MNTLPIGVPASAAVDRVANSIPIRAPTRSTGDIWDTHAYIMSL